MEANSLGYPTIRRTTPGVSLSLSRSLLLVSSSGIRLPKIRDSMTSLVGTEFNVVGNDWRNGMVIFTLDGVSDQPYDLGSVTNDTSSRCRFPWITRQNLAPTTHTFTFSLIAPSETVMVQPGDIESGANAYYGVQFFYFS